MQRCITTSSHVLKRGFTIIELMVVIVVLGILLAIAIDSVSGYQSQARDRERKADVYIIFQNLERYYKTQAVAVGPTYPASTVGAAGLTTIIDEKDATNAPQQVTTSIVIATSGSTQSPTVNQYIYQPLNINGTLCTTVPCVKYKIFYKLEVSGTIVIQDSTRQQ